MCIHAYLCRCFPLPPCILKVVILNRENKKKTKTVIKLIVVDDGWQKVKVKNLILIMFECKRNKKNNYTLNTNFACHGGQSITHLFYVVKLLKLLEFI